MLLKFTKQENFHSQKQKPKPSLIIVRYLGNFLKTAEKTKAGPQEIKDENVKYILSEVYKNGSLSAKNL